MAASIQYFYTMRQKPLLVAFGEHSKAAIPVTTMRGPFSWHELEDHLRQRVKDSGGNGMDFHVYEVPVGVELRL